MTARRHAVLAVTAAVLAVMLWWLSRDLVAVRPPEVDPPVDGDDWIVDGAPEFAPGHEGGVGRGVAGGAVHLGTAAQ